MQNLIRILRRPCLVLCGLLVLAAPGCKRSDRPELGEVRGTVFLDGKTLEGAGVYFSPEGGGRVSEALTDAQGVYELVYIGQTRGAKVGKHRVRITTASDTRKEVVPARYNSAETELSAQVEPGSNTLDFQLKSGP